MERIFIHEGKRQEVNESVKSILGSSKNSSEILDSQTMVDRFVYVMLNEAVDVLKKVIENPAYLDMAMIFRTVFLRSEAVCCVMPIPLVFRK